MPRSECHLVAVDERPWTLRATAPVVNTRAYLMARGPTQVSTISGGLLELSRLPTRRPRGNPAALPPPPAPYVELENVSCRSESACRVSMP